MQGIFECATDLKAKMTGVGEYWVQGVNTCMHIPYSIEYGPVTAFTCQVP